MSTSNPNERKESFLRNRKEHEKIRAGIEISSGYRSPSTADFELSLVYDITNTGHLARKFIALEYDALNEYSNLPISFETTGERDIDVGGSLCLTTHMNLVGPGNFCIVLWFKFDSFSIARYVDYHIGNHDLYQELAPKNPFQKKKRKKHGPRDDRRVISSTPPSRQGNRPYKINLAKFNFPDVHKHVIVNEILRLRKEVDQSIASRMKVYCKIFISLLRLEENKQRDNLTEYDMERVTMTKVGVFFALNVPGLAEKRPSVLIGDIIYVRPHGSSSNKKYEGYVYRVQLDRVLLKVSNRLFNANHHLYDIEFALNRLSWRLLHQPLAEISKRVDIEGLYQYLHPIRTDPPYLARASMSWSRLNTGLNRKQMEAVDNIVYRGCGKIAPYIIFGPPGTGKTVTVIEMIRQAHQLDPNRKILVCAPSNTAADLIVERLADHIDITQMFRVMAFSRSLGDVSARVQAYCRQENGNFVIPEIKILESYNILVATCGLAAKLYNLGISKGFFSYVIIDECGNAFEPEVLACFVPFWVHYETQVILAGDPKQLGPVTTSADAKEHGLGVSLLERLIDRDAYQKLSPTRCYDQNYVTMLVDSYRCHPDIIHVPNELFYDNNLNSKLSPTDFIGSRLLPNPAFPLIFHSSFGKNLQEDSSPSWFNIAEVEIVVSYVKKILLEKGTSYAKHIGIISPYHKQVQKIRKHFQSRETCYQDIMVGSCEQFQGQERKVIIITTVRSSPEKLTWDKKFDLGFVDNPKRLNVAITRAQALLIIVGNRNVLQLDENWKRMIGYIDEHGGSVR
jgi:helicase MOV-10